MDPEDLIVLGAPAETQAAGGEVSDATEALEGGQPEGGDVATPGTDTAAPAGTPEAPKVEGGDDEDGRPKKRTGIHRMQEKIARLEAQLAERTAPTGDGGDRKASIEKEIGAPPKESDFEDYVAFEDAKADYRLKRVLAEQRASEREVQSATRQVQARQEAVEAFNDRMEEAREKIPDFDQVVQAAKGREIAPHVGDLIVESEKGGLLAYYLAKNPAELAKLNGMSAIQAAKAVGALEHRLTLAKPKKTPSAPAPGTPITGSASAGPDPSKMTFAEYEKWRASNRG